MAYFFNVVLVFLEQPKRSGRKQTTSMSSLINKKIRANDVSFPKPHPQVSSPPLSDLEQRIKLISSKLDEGNVKGGIRLAASDDKIAPFSTDNYQKMLSKHPQRAKFAAPNPEKFDSFFRNRFRPIQSCNSRLLRSHMKLKKNRPYNHWLTSQGHYLLCFSTSRTVGANSVRLRLETRTRYSLKATTKISPHSRK